MADTTPLGIIESALAMTGSDLLAMGAVGLSVAVGLYSMNRGWIYLQRFVR